MRLIAHRGNFDGQDDNRENTFIYLEEALAEGYDVEFDVRIRDGQLYLGHNRADCGKVPNIEWLRDSRKWVHCKDMASFVALSKYPDIQCFMHNDEPIAQIENSNKIWTHSRTILNPLQKEVAPNTYIVHESSDEYCGIAGIYGYNVSKFKHLRDEPWNITTILLDVDGVMTNGKKTYDKNGNCIGKEFCDKDWTAIKRMQSAGLKVIMVSADPWNMVIADKRKVEFIPCQTTGVISKLNMLRTQQDMDLSKCIYIGDDYYDIELLVHAGGAWCPEDSIQEVKDVACVIPAKGGENCVAAFYEQIKHHLRENFPHEQ